MTDAELAAIEARAKSDLPYMEIWPYGGSKERQVVLSSDDADRLMAVWRDTPALIAEVRRLRSGLCDPCLCRLEHPQPCQCWNDE